MAKCTTDGEDDMDAPGLQKKKRGGMIRSHKEMSGAEKHGHKMMPEKAKHGHKPMKNMKGA